jgi:hypothetical protein
MKKLGSSVKPVGLPAAVTAQPDADLLVKRITNEFDTLSRQLKLIAR